MGVVLNITTTYGNTNNNNIQTTKTIINGTITNYISTNQNDTMLTKNTFDAFVTSYLKHNISNTNREKLISSNIDLL